jgi:hypothetical protein
MSGRRQAAIDRRHTSLGWVPGPRALFPVPVRKISG